MNPESIIESWHNNEDLSLIQKMRDDLGWTSWLAVAEIALLYGSPLVDVLRDEMSAAENAVLDLVVMRIAGEVSISDVEKALAVVRDPEQRDLLLEGRLRMEAGLIRFESEDFEQAREDFSWAETRLKSVAKASREHDIALINKAAFHLALDEPLMALQVYGDISRKDGHADETIAISRMNAARILLAFDRIYEALRNSFIAHIHAIIAENIALAIESGAIFVEIALPHIEQDAARMKEQLANAKPRDAEEEEIKPAIHPEDMEGVLSWCVEKATIDIGGNQRGDLKALLILCERAKRLDFFNHTLQRSGEVEDVEFANLCYALTESEEWSTRISELAALEANF